MTQDECVYINLISGGSHMHSLFIASMLCCGTQLLASISYLLGLLQVMPAAKSSSA